LPSGTTVTIPATGTAAPASDTVTTATVSPATVVVRSTEPVVTATVKATDGTPAAGGTVNVYVDGQNRGTAAISEGTAQVKLPAFATTGSQLVVVEYTGVSGTTNDSSTSLRVDVVRATPDMQVVVQPDTIKKKKTKPVVKVSLTAPGQVATGTVVVRQGGAVIGTGTLSDGRTSITLPAYDKSGNQVVTVEYLGSELAEGVSRQVSFAVTN
jgi:hypothetical protein